MNTDSEQPKIKNNTSAETEIISNILHGKKEDFTQIADRYSSYLYQVGRSYGLDHRDTEDAVQEALINAYAHLKDFRFQASFKTWITRIMVHECYHKKVKSEKRHKMITDLFSNASETDLLLFLKDKTLNTKKVVTNWELRAVLEKAIQYLPESYGTVFDLRERKGMTVKQTASLMHITESNVKTRLCRAKRLLRGELKNLYA